MVNVTTALLVLLVITGGCAQGPDNQGTEFILAFMTNLIGTGNDIELFFTTVSNEDVYINITAPLYNGALLEEVTVSRGIIVKVLIDYNIRGVGTELTGKTVWIQSTDEVVVYAVNKEEYSTDAYVGIPVDALGQEYYAMTFYDQTEFAIAGVVDGTNVDITFPTMAYSTTSVTYNGVTYGSGQTLSITLNRFQSFHAYQESSGWNDAPDFTGTHIVSDQIIGVVSGNKKVTVPYGGVSSDHLTEMLFPVECWGKKFLSYSTPDRGIGDIMRILASEDGTTITITRGSGVTTETLNAGAFLEYDVQTDDVMTIESDYGLTVGIFSKTFNNDGPNFGDPAFSFLIPTPLFASDYTYSTIQLPSGAEFNNKLTITIEDANKDGLRLDEDPLSVTWSEVPGSNGYVTGWLYVSAGSHNIYHTDPAKTFMSLATGTEEFNSYAFASGMRMTQINRPCTRSAAVAADVIDNDCDGSIDEETANGIDDDGDGEIDEDIAMPPRVNGEWGSWGNWSECSVTCLGAGRHVRTRDCDNPQPANNGIYCVGDGTEYLPCDNTLIPCGVLSEWSEWTPCSVTCNEGTRERDRNCTDIVTGLVDECISDELNQTEICDVGPLQGVCYNNVSGNCSYCDWGYTGSSCDACVSNYTGCYCEYCKTDLIGYDTNCSTPCYHGYASITGGDYCLCDANTTLGFWQGDDCSYCIAGFIFPDCLDCDDGWVGYGHCSIPCTNGSFSYDYDGTTGDDDIIPEFACLVNDTGSNVLAWFGYSSFNSKVVTIATGPNHFFEGAAANSPETNFRPGFHQYVFTVGPFPFGEHVSWTLIHAGLNYTATVPGSPVYCVGSIEADTLASVSLSDDIGYCKCDNGMYGASCTYECPGGASSPCSNHGDCRVTDGACVCQARFTSEMYDFELYDEGYVSSTPGYSCDTCSQDWEGTDCSTAVLSRYKNSSNHHATVASSGIITLDGATVEIVQPGAYRLVETSDTIVDGYFEPCEGRHDCHTLTEVALSYYAHTISVAIDDNNNLVLNSTISGDTSASFSEIDGNVTLQYMADNVVRIIVADGPNIVMQNVQGEIILGVEVPVNTSGVSGVLGSSDGDWVNDITSGSTVQSYSAADLTATKKAVYMNTFKLDSNNSTLIQSDLSVSTGSGGYAISLNSTAYANVSGLPFIDMDAFTIEMWVKIPETSGTDASLIEFDTSEGVASLSVESGLLTASWGGVYKSSIRVSDDTWTYIAMTWEGADGNVSLHRISGSSASEETTGMNSRTTVQSGTSVAFGGGPTADVNLDYVRIFDKVRTETEMLSDYGLYRDEFIENQVFLALFDEGGSSTSFKAYTTVRDIFNTHTGSVTNAAWSFSDVQFTDVLTADQLDPIVSNADAVNACDDELNGAVFTLYCNDFTAVKQMLMENCISDYMRTNDTSIVKLAGSAFAFYCQGITQNDECLFTGYLDFCYSWPSAGGSSGSMVFAIAGAAGGLLILAAIAACCCCCLKGICARKKIFDSSSEEEEEEEEPEEEMPPVQDAKSTTELQNAGLPLGGKAAILASTAPALTMREKGKMSLGPEKPFEPLHEGRWTAYGWLPGAMPVDGVSSTPPDELGVDAQGNPLPPGEAGQSGNDQAPMSAMSGKRSAPPPPKPSSGAPSSVFTNNSRANTLTSISVHLETPRDSLTPLGE